MMHAPTAAPPLNEPFQIRRLPQPLPFEAYQCYACKQTVFEAIQDVTDEYPSYAAEGDSVVRAQCQQCGHIVPVAVTTKGKVNLVPVGYQDPQEPHGQ